MSVPNYYSVTRYDYFVLRPRTFSFASSSRESARDDSSKEPTTFLTYNNFHCSFPSKCSSFHFSNHVNSTIVAAEND